VVPDPVAKVQFQFGHTSEEVDGGRTVWSDLQLVGLHGEVDVRPCRGAGLAVNVELNMFEKNVRKFFANYSKMFKKSLLVINRFQVYYDYLA
jgi:hypothetical protein